MSSSCSLSGFHFKAASVHIAIIKCMLQNVAKRNILYASLTSCRSEAYDSWGLKQGGYKDLDLSVVSIHWPNPTVQTAKIMLLPQNMTSCDFFFPLSFFQIGDLLLFCLICCSCWHVWGEQHPSYNSFGSWIHCIVTGCSGLSTFFHFLGKAASSTTSEDKLQRHLPSSGACCLLFSLDRTGMMYWVRSTACGTIFLALPRDLSLYSWTNALC